jgi:hypothetical protein
MRKLLKFIGPIMLPVLMLALGLTCLVECLTVSDWYIWVPCFFVATITITIPVLEYWKTIFTELMNDDSDPA